MIEKHDVAEMSANHYNISVISVWVEHILLKQNEIIDQVNLITKSLEGRQFYEQERK